MPAPPAVAAKRAVTSEAIMPSMGYALPPLDVFDTIFGRCHGDNLIAIGSRRPSKGKPTPFPHALIAVPVSARHDWLPEVFEHEISQTQYLIPNALSPKALWPGKPKPIGEHAKHTAKGQEGPQCW